MLLLLCTENNIYFCNGCDSKFTEEDSLKEHMAQVHSDKPYKCDCCQAAFRYKGNLASHKTVHTGKINNSSFSKYHQAPLKDVAVSFIA